MAADRPDSISRYRQVAADIRRRIRTGALAAGARLPPISQLCREYEVSHITIRSALKELAVSGVVESQPRLGVFVRGGENSEPREPAAPGVPQALLLRSDYPSRRGELVTRALYENLVERGYSVLVLTFSDVDQLRDLLAHAPRAAALVVGIPPEGYVETQLLDFLKRRAHYIVFESLGPRLMDVDTVAEDAVACVSLAARHLWELGHRRIAFLSGEPAYLSCGAYDSFLSVARVLEPCGGEFSVHISPTAPGSSAQAAMRDFLAGRMGELASCTGAIAYSHVSALGALQAFESAGRRVPRDLSLVAIDHCDLPADHGTALTMVGATSREIAAQIAATIDLRRQDAAAPCEHRIVPRVADGGSTRRLDDS